MTQEERGKCFSLAEKLENEGVAVTIEVTQKAFGTNKLSLDKMQFLSQWSGTAQWTVIYLGLHPLGSPLSAWAPLCGVDWS